MSRWLIRWAVTTAAVACSLLATTTAQAAFPGQNGKIAYTNLVEQGPPPPTTHYSIFTVNPDGTGLQNLNPDPPSDFEPAWSADGTKIAFSSSRISDSSYDIWFMNADGSGVQRVTSTFAADRQPAWSPDGTKIAFIANLDGNVEIYVVNVDGSGLHNVTNNRENQESGPVWSPDGTKILYGSHTTNFSPNIPHIWVINADGTNQMQVTTGATETGPDWSPDSTKISYSRPAPCNPTCQNTHVYIANPDGSGEQEIANPARSISKPKWSPDGAKFVFGSFGSIWTMNTDATGEFEVVPRGADQDDPEWGPTFGTGYPRPKAASPLITSLVPAYEQCTAANRTHGPPLAFPSCASPAPTSSSLTVGTPDADGAPAAAVGHVRLKVFPGAPGPPHDTQLGVYLDLADVRCTALAQPCGSPNAQAGADYTGELEGRVTLRITDSFNSVSGGGGTDRATMTDYTLHLPMFVPCAATASTAVGSTCSVATEAGSFVPGITPEGRRSIWEVGQVQVFDGGPDGDAGTAADNQAFAKQGLFVP